MHGQALTNKNFNQNKRYSGSNHRGGGNRQKDVINQTWERKTYISCITKVNSSNHAREPENISAADIKSLMSEQIVLLIAVIVILQLYLNQPNLRVFVNLQQELKQILDIIDNNPNSVFRVGTGEFTDSLAVDHITGLSDIIVPPFSKEKKCSVGT